MTSLRDHARFALAFLLVVPFAGAAGTEAVPDAEPDPERQSRSRSPSAVGVPFTIRESAGRLRTLLAPTADGALSADTGPFLARFDGDRLTVFARDAAGELSAGLSLAYAFSGVFVDGEPVPDALDPRDGARWSENRIEFDRSGLLTERYEVLETGVEQIFVLHRRPDDRQGDLEIRGLLATSLIAEHPDPGSGRPLVFRAGADPWIRIGRVLVRDAAGRELLGRLRVSGDRLSIVVDGGWLSEATYPVEIDPLIGVARFLSGYGPAIAHDVAYNRAGDVYLVVWERATSPTDSDVWGALIDYVGNIVNTGFAIEADASSSQTVPSAGWSILNRWLVCWQDDRNKSWLFPSNYDIFCRLLEPAGAAVTSVGWLDLNGGPVDRQSNPDVACGWSDCLVVYEDGNDGGYPDWDIDGALVDTAGSGSLVASQISFEAGTAYQERPAVVFNGSDAGEYMLAWTVWLGEVWDIHARVVDTSANPTGPICDIAVDPVTQYGPDVAYSPHSQAFLIAWRESVATGRTDVHFKTLTSDCTPLTDDLLLFGSTGSADYVRVAGGATDGCFAAAILHRAGASPPYEIELRTACADGSITDAATISTFVESDHALAVGYNEDRNDYLVTWADPAGVRGQFYAGSVCPDADDDAFAVCDGICALDGYDHCGDCDDTDPNVRPGAPEICDRKDNDCNGQIPPDEEDGDGDGLSACDGDCDGADPDSYPGAPEICDGADNDCDGQVPPDEVDGDGDLYRLCDGDCDDTNDRVHPGAWELCGDLLDNDCDKYVDCWDPDCDAFPFCVCPDADRDGWADCRNGCTPPSPSMKCGDCNDFNRFVNPLAPEDCGNGIDDDCDGRIDADDPYDCSPVCPDADEDRWAVCTAGCAPALFDQCGDCNDAVAGINPGVAEHCQNGIDDDCDGQTDGADGDCPLCPDGDGDDWAVCSSSCALAGGDQCGECDDSLSSVHPGAPEACDELDTDCDGTIPASETDGDGDGQPPCLGDCDDGNPQTYDGATEVCDGEDNDCDTVVPANEIDGDGDGLSSCAGDCDDGDADTYPGAPELCDRVDNDCDAVLPGNEVDGDGDGYTGCEGDCNDFENAIGPDETEVCDNLVDDDCDGLTDCWDAECAGVPQCQCVDADADDWVSCGDGCTPLPGDRCGECDDSNGLVNPGIPEDCGNAIDDDCDGLADGNDPDCMPPCPDQDGDLWAVCDSPCVLDAGDQCGDCDDIDGGTHPGAADDRCNGIDNDCDGSTDEHATPPGETPTLSVDHDSLSWSAVADAGGYRVVRGDLSLLCSSAGDFEPSTEECVEDDYPGTSTPYAGEPAAGEGYWFLVGAMNCAGLGTYDSGGTGQQGSRDAEILAANVCP